MAATHKVRTAVGAHLVGGQGRELVDLPTDPLVALARLAVADGAEVVAPIR